ncbi:hypothetical protein GH871_34945, partial [Bacillus thuringiensis]|nr:hypothetical protein [Bacillus thuringiensis]MRD28999.1 hypothetical protein [Bacillus thuringiensis]
MYCDLSDGDCYSILNARICKFIKDFIKSGIGKGVIHMLTKMKNWLKNEDSQLSSENGMLI